MFLVEVLFGGCVSDVFLVSVSVSDGSRGASAVDLNVLVVVLWLMRWWIDWFCCRWWSGLRCG